MLPSPFRLRREKEIDRVFRGGRSEHGAYASIRFAPNRLPMSRATVVAGLKVDKRAVYRNKVKRRVREAIRRHWEGIREGFDIVVMVRAEALKTDFKGLEADVGAVFRRAGLLR